MISWQVQLRSLLGSNVIVRVAVIRNQGAPTRVACQFNSVWVDVFHRGEKRFTLIHNHGLVLIFGGLSNHWIDILVHFDATSSIW